MSDKFLSYVELDLDYCQESYGTGNCTAALGVTGERKCHNVRPDCQDPPNYNPAPKTYRLYEDNPYVPTTLDGFPCLEEVDIAESEIRLNKALGDSEEITVTCRDFSHHDRGIDKYASERVTGAAMVDPADAYDPSERGTFFGKLRARNIYYVDRPLRYYHGRIPWDDSKPAEEQPDWSFAQLKESLQVRHYIIESFKGPSGSGQFTIRARDTLSIVKGKDAVAPLLSTGELSADFLIGQTVFNLKSGQGAEYPTSGTGSIGRETFDFTRSGDQITVVNGRGNYGTQEEDHSADDLFQLAYTVIAKRVDVICNDLMVNYGQAKTAWLDLAQWSAEADQFLPRLYSVVVTKPTEVDKLLDELGEIAGFNLYPNTKENKIKMSAIKAPSFTSEVIDDETWIVRDSIQIEDMPKERVSQVWTSYGIINPQEKLKDQNNYQRTLRTTDAEAEGPDQYGKRAIREIYSRWIDNTGTIEAQDINDRVISRFRDYIRKVNFDIYATRENQLQMGDTRLLKCFEAQDATGDKEVLSARIIGVRQKGDYLGVRTIEQRYIPPPVVARVIDIDTTEFNVNLRSFHDARFAPPTGSEPITFVINSNAVIGSTSTGQYSIDTGNWPVGQPITIFWYGYAGGRGGRGGDGAPSLTGAKGQPGQNGGPCFIVRVPLKQYHVGTIGGGAGGGAGGDNGTTFQGGNAGGSGGGGGAGQNPGQGGFGRGTNGGDIEDGSPGDRFNGGAEGDGTPFAGPGGNGGNLGQAGGNGETAVGGQPGVAIEGYSNITWVESDGVTPTPGNVPAGGQVLGPVQG